MYINKPYTGIGYISKETTKRRPTNKDINFYYLPDKVNFIYHTEEKFSSGYIKHIISFTVCEPFSEPYTIDEYWTNIPAEV